MLTRVTSAYFRFISGRPRIALAVLLLLLGFFGYHAQYFELDASADSLLLEDDEDLHRLRQVSARYRSRALLIVTFTPDGDLFSDESLAAIGRLRDDLAAVDGVESVRSILDVPLLKSSDVPLLELANNVQTLESPTIDRERAREELVSSPVFRELVISRDSQTTALLIYLEQNPASESLLRARNQLLIKRRASPLSGGERQELAAVGAAYKGLRSGLNDRRHETIAMVRSVIDAHRSSAVLHLGGFPMIADDMITYVRSDLVVFGVGVLVFLVVVLTVIFGQPRWVLLPLLSCFYASVIMLGLLGLIGWEVTVISSNFLALMLIITISMNIHLTVRYRQLQRDQPDAEHVELVSSTLRRMVWPCLYTALTTIIGFSSLVFSNIKPVQDFGWMMSAGLSVAFLTSFSVFPVVLLTLGKPRGIPPHTRGFALTARLATVTDRYGSAILVVAVLLVIASGVGISRLTVENSFIDYFREDTEIFRGMKLIDDKLGGTTTFEVLLNLDANRFADPSEDGDDEFEDEFEDWNIDVASGPEYWFTPYKIDRIKEVHDYLEGLPPVGKVLSLASLIRVAEDLNDGREFDGIELSVLYRRLPDDIRSNLIAPYVSFEHDEARIQGRIRDSREGLRRNELLEEIHDGLRTRFGLTERDVTVTGALVLYNNMLQSLFRSQISSLGAVMIGIALMFLLLFRSPSLAVIGIVPNLLAAGAVLGLMGLVGIPLDVMTITIAAITIGIAVDNSIHYIYRFREEFPQTGDYTETLHACHTSIGRAVLYTSMTVIFGFSILMLSNFLPTIYFGALTGLAMAIALLAALTLLPKLILVWKPF